MLCKFPVSKFKGYWYWNADEKGTVIKNTKVSSGATLFFQNTKGSSRWNFGISWCQYPFISIPLTSKHLQGVLWRTSHRPWMLHTYPLVEKICGWHYEHINKEQVETLFNLLNSVDIHIKFTMEAPGNDDSIPFSNTKCSPNSDHTIQTSVYRKPTHTDCYLDWNSISVKTQPSMP